MDIDFIILHDGTVTNDANAIATMVEVIANAIA